MAERTIRQGEVSGFVSVIPAVIRELEDSAYQIVEFTLAGIESDASATAPIGPTGFLAGSQGHESRRIHGGAEGEATSGAGYSAYVNFGTGGRGAGSAVPNRPPEIQYSAGWIGMTARPYFSQAAVDAEAEWHRAWQTLESRLPRIR